jgi:hypothetical protein
MSINGTDANVKYAERLVMKPMFGKDASALNVRR